MKDANNGKLLDRIADLCEGGSIRLRLQDALKRQEQAARDIDAILSRFGGVKGNKTVKKYVILGLCAQCGGPKDTGYYCAPCRLKQTEWATQRNRRRVSQEQSPEVAATYNNDQH